MSFGTQIFGAIISLAVTAVVVRCLLKRYQAQIILLTAGVVLLACAVLLGADSAQILPAKVKSTGWIGFDIFKFVERILSSRVGDLGLIIMAAGGYATYMDKIGASKAMVFAFLKPLRNLKAPYVLLAVVFVVGAVLKVFIPSAAGLALLLMVTMFPIVVALGASTVAAAAMVATCGGFDLGPASGPANVGALNAGLDVTLYFVTYQIPVGIVGYITAAVLHYFTQKYFDKKDKLGAVYGDGAGTDYDISAAQQKVEGAPVPPAFYIVLPTVPLILLLVFSPFVLKQYKIDVVTAMLISFAVAFACECVRHRKNLKEATINAMTFFQGMSKLFSTAVLLIVAGETFAQGLTAIGTVDLLISSAQNSGFGVTGMTLVMILFIVVMSVLLGSGNAPFFAFASLAPKIAKDLAVPALWIVLPMQMAAGMARMLSPISAVVVAVSTMAGCHPFEIVRRTAIPMVGSIAMVTIASMILNG